MKQDAAVVVTKAICYMVIGAGTPAGAALTQCISNKQPIDKIAWVIICIGAAVGGASQLLGFLSGTYSDFVKGRANGSASPTDTTTILAAKAANQPIKTP